VLIEVRNDLLATAEGVSAWCGRIGGIFEEAMAVSEVRLGLGSVRVE
jgi:predicted N-formylglutamate amidohydrolase